MACDILDTAATGNDAQSKLETLRRLKDHIKEIQKQCMFLEKELAVQNRPVANVRAMPPEILSIIFGFYVEKTPRSIRRLMLVCRQWHDIVIHNPQFWNTIKIDAVRYGYQGDYQQGVKRLRPFIQACVRRSGAALLHIDLDLSSLLPWDRHVESELIYTFMGLFPGSNTIYERVMEEDWSWCAEDRAGDPPGHHSHILELLHNLGPKSRWGSLNFVNTEYSELAEEIWVILAGDTPNLKSLSVYEYPGDEIEGLGVPFGDLSSLEILKVADIETLQIIDPTSSLKHLEVETRLDQRSAEVLNGLTGLHTLKISSPYGYAPPEQSITLNLSKLRNLHLLRSHTHVTQIKYNLPALQDLFLTDQNADFFNHPLDVQPVHVHWNLQWPLDDNVSSVAEKILMGYSTAKSITARTDAKRAVLEVVTQFKRAEKLSAELETLFFETDTGVIDEVIRVDDI